MKDLTPAQEATIEPPTCDHAPVCVEWHAMHGTDDYGHPQVYKLVAGRFACWKCAKILPIDLKFLVLREKK